VRSCWAEESGAALRQRLKIAKAATSDPWLKRDDPYHPRQFSDLDEPDDGEQEPELPLAGPPPEGAR